MWTVDRKLWKTQDGKIVEDGDPLAYRLFAVPGQVLDADPLAATPPEDEDENEWRPEDEDEKLLAKSEDKAVKMPESKSPAAKAKGKK